MLQENIEVVPLTDLEFQELVGRMLGSDWEYNSEPYCFKLAKQIGVEFWQVGVLAYFTSMNDLMGGGDLAWICTTAGPIGGKQWFYKDVAVRVYSKEGELIADKRPRDFTYRELMKYAVDYLWVMPKEWVDVRCAFQFSSEEIAELKRILPLKKQLVSKERHFELTTKIAEYSEEMGSITYKMTLGEIKEGKKVHYYVGTATPSEKPRMVNPLNADETLYVVNRDFEWVDKFPVPKLTFEAICKYGPDHLFVDLAEPLAHESAHFDAIVAAYKAAHPEK